MNKKYLSVKEAAELSSLSKWYLYKLTAKRALPLLRIGKRRLIIPADAFIAWLDKHQVDSRGDGDE